MNGKKNTFLSKKRASVEHPTNPLVGQHEVRVNNNSTKNISKKYVCISKDTSCDHSNRTNINNKDGTNSTYADVAKRAILNKSS